MATNNAINITSAGIPVYNGSGTFTAISTPVSVANGGIGASSLTAYAVLCGGTTSTGNIQSIAGVGTQNQALTSNGAASLPTMQNVTITWSGYNGSWRVAQLTSPADSTTYYGSLNGIFTTNQFPANTKFMIPKAGTITAAYGVVRVNGTLGSNENVTLAFRINNTTDANITTTSQWTAAENTFNNASMSQAVSAGDYVQLKIVTPAWGTNPTQASISCTMLVTF
jgi:hypothetical protein